MIASGELFLLNGDTGGELRPLGGFEGRNIRVITSNFDRVYITCEPPVCPKDCETLPCTVWCFKGDNNQPTRCPEFDGIKDGIRQIAFGEKHTLVLTSEGEVFSYGSCVCGSVGIGGSKDAPEFRPLPALKGRKVRFIAAGPYYSIAITNEGDVYSWGQAFNGETGLLGPVEAVPRFANEATKLRVTEVSCGQAHVLARTESQQCVSWGENTCGQLGVGDRSKPTYKPQLLDSIPSKIHNISAGWAHSVAVGSDGRAYSWGLNSHGQLGLGDTTMRLAPHLLHDLVNAHQVESAHAARALTVFRAADCHVLLCGQIPCTANATLTAEFHPRRPGERDPKGCLLVPMALTLTTGHNGPGSSASEITEVVAFDRGALGFAHSTVYRVAPNLAPAHGGTAVRAFVTGLPFDPPGRKRSPDEQPVQDLIPLKVRLKAVSPHCDTVVPGRIVDRDTVEFTTPNIAQSPLGSVVQEGVTCAVQLRISIDDGFTWTQDRHSAPRPEELDRTQRASATTTFRGTLAKSKLKDITDDFAASRKLQRAVTQGQTVLWFCRWPAEDGPSHVEPNCAPVTGGTELLLHVELPQGMPTEHLTVRLSCEPLHSVGDPELESRAPMRRDSAEMLKPCREALARLPLAGHLEVPVSAWLDPGGRGVRCISPPLDAESVRFYKYSVELSLDGNVFLPRSLPFAIYDLRVTGLEPNVGPLMEETRVAVRGRGFVDSEVHKVRVDFPKELGWESRVLPASIDHTTGDICFTMPSLAGEVKQRTEEFVARAAQLVVATSPPPGTEDGSIDPEMAAVDPDGGMHGVEVCIELSLNGQNFTEDRICFTYHGQLDVEPMQVLSRPEGAAPEPPKEDAKAGKKSKVLAEEPMITVLKPGTKLGCRAKPLMESAKLTIRMELSTKLPDHEMQPWRSLDLPASVELVKLTGVPEGSPHGSPSPGENKAAEEDHGPQVEMLVAMVPEIQASEAPAGAEVHVRGFGVSLNGQSFISCPDAALAMKLELVKPEPAPA